MRLEQTLMNRCPQCGQGKVFRTLVRMNETCSECKHRFERESGYFAGAMAISYILGFFFILPPLIYLLYIDASFPVMVGVPSVLIILFAPFSYRYSRLIWMGVDFGRE